MAAALFALLPSLRLGAQELKSAWFLDNFIYKYELNPAMHDSETTSMFVGFAINNFGLDLHTNVGANSFIFPRNGELVHFMNGEVSSDEFLAGIPAAGVRANVNLNYDLLSFGFKAGKHGFFTFDARLRSKTDVSASKDFFGQLKNLELSSRRGTEYQFDYVGVDTDNYLELALDYSFQIAQGVRLGVAAKGLLGLAKAGASLSDGVYVNFIDDDVAMATAKARLDLSSKMLNVPVDGGIYDFTHIGFGKVGLSGFGGAVDLGVSWDSPFGLSLSAAVLDLGAMSWTNTIHGENTLDGEVMTGDNVNEYFAQVFDLDPSAVQKPAVNMLPTLFDVGARYYMPFYKGLSVGLHGNYQLKTNFYDVRLGLTISPARWFSFTANYGWNNFGGTLGAAMNLRPGPFTIFLGAETTFYKFMAQGIPLGPLNTTAKFGIIISPKVPKAKKS